MRNYKLLSKSNLAKHKINFAKSKFLSFLEAITMPKKLLKFLILLDNSSLLYYPGQFLSGRVLLELQDETPVLCLNFHVIGEGVVQVRSARQERTYDKENFIDFRMKLLGDGDRVAPILSPGIHSFPFKLGLPLGLPSTFLGRYGWIQYYCKAALHETSGLIHKNYQVVILMSPIDLNLKRNTLSVCEEERIQTFRIITLFFRNHLHAK